ncbi:hypothetical protein LJC04_01005 [Ruminococcaceae bacterium OttesenSCG-928-O06]|nr:hypothetical protein [Ruminococcaceae bacterium OttesenSCG-928-O06]
MKVFLKVLMWIAIVAVVVFLVLFITVQVADEFDSIPQLIRYLMGQYTPGGRALAPVPFFPWW